MGGAPFGSGCVYPFVERWITGDTAEHHVLDRPRNAPTRTALGVAGMTCYAMFWIAGGNDILATQFKVSLNAVTEFMRVAVFVAPIIAFIVTKRICVSLQRVDSERVLHGSETGRVFRTEGGEVFELHAPLSPQDRWLLVQFDSHRPAELIGRTDSSGVRRPGSRLDGLRQKISTFYFEDRVEPVTPAELHEAQHHGHEELSASGGDRPVVTAGAGADSTSH
jgi:ubiquinol-cytochrome c reductase cytochrome b subunit